MRTLSTRQFTAHRAANQLRQLLDDPRYAARATAVAEQMRTEDGVSSACHALERLLPDRSFA